jgi:hypothetical protein
MSLRNYADGVGNHCTAILSGHFRSLLAQFALTPKSKRGLVPVGAWTPLAWEIISERWKPHSIA